MIYSFLFLFQENILCNKKDTKINRENNLLVDICYIENRIVTCEELEVTEEIKLGYGVAAGKNVNRTTNIRPFKRDLKRVVQLWTLQVLSFACIHIVTNISCTKGFHKVSTTKLLNSQHFLCFGL